MPLPCTVRRLSRVFSRRSRNHLTNRWERARQRVVLRSAPIVYVIGINNICNLSCPLCVTGRHRQVKKRGEMEFGLFKQIIDKTSPYAIYVQLYNWGEPLLHSEITRMLSYCAEHDLNTEISSNLSLADIDDILEALVVHRLKHLVVSFDGVDQDDYARYRVNGQFDLVLENLAALRRFKEKHRSDCPRVTLQYLRTRFTTDQPEAIRRNLGLYGADDLIVEDLGMPFQDYDAELAREWLKEEEISRRRYLDVGVSMHARGCPFLYSTMVIEQDGSIPPCCYSTSPEDDFGRWNNDLTLQQMFNAEGYQAGRKLFRSGVAGAGSVCSRCSAFQLYRSASHSHQ